MITKTESKRRAIVAFPAVLFLGAISMVILPALNSGAQSGHDLSEPVRGKQLFERRCGGCHSLDADQTGPRLRTVYGRKAGSIAAFRYSAAVRSAGFTWDDNALDKWLTDPDSLIPGNEMDFSVPKPEERAAIIRFLRLCSEK